jgi:hypothetical protein
VARLGDRLDESRASCARAVELLRPAAARDTSPAVMLNLAESLRGLANTERRARRWDAARAAVREGLTVVDEVRAREPRLQWARHYLLELMVAQGEIERGAGRLAVARELLGGAVIALGPAERQARDATARKLLVQALGSAAEVEAALGARARAADLTRRRDLLTAQ